jgi:hypothetical protein
LLAAAAGQLLLPLRLDIAGDCILQGTALHCVIKGSSGLVLLLLAVVHGRMHSTSTRRLQFAVHTQAHQDWEQGCLEHMWKVYVGLTDSSRVDITRQIRRGFDMPAPVRADVPVSSTQTCPCRHGSYRVGAVAVLLCRLLPLLPVPQHQLSQLLLMGQQE